MKTVFNLCHNFTTLLTIELLLAIVVQIVVITLFLDEYGETK